MNKVTWNDLHEATPQEIKEIYNLSDKDLEISIRHHIDGTNEKERRDLYQQFYSRRK